MAIDPRNTETTSDGQAEKPETLVLLDEFAALGFMLHTHHPMTHTAILDAPVAEDPTHVRNECPGDLVPSFGGRTS